MHAKIKEVFVLMFMLTTFPLVEDTSAAAWPDMRAILIFSEDANVSSLLFPESIPFFFSNMGSRLMIDLNACFKRDC